MSVRFFKKLEPSNSPILANGAKCVFSTLNHLVGYFSSDNAYVCSELERLMKAGKYGMTEIPSAEFHADYLEVKKKQGGIPSRRLWREEVQPRGYNSDTQSPSVKKVVVAPDPSEIAKLVAKAMPVTASDTPQAATLTNPVEFKPTAVKRSRARKRD